MLPMVAYLIYGLIKFRWAMKVLDLHRVDSISYIPENPGLAKDPA